MENNNEERTTHFWGRRLSSSTKRGRFQKRVRKAGASDWVYGWEGGYDEILAGISIRSLLHREPHVPGRFPAYRSVHDVLSLPDVETSWSTSTWTCGCHARPLTLCAIASHHTKHAQ